MDESQLAPAFSRIIIESGLVESGALASSITCTVQFTGSELVFHIFGKDYLQYHLEEKRLIEKFVETPEFVGVCNNWFAIILDQSLQNSFDTGQPINMETALPKITILVN